MAKRCLAHSFDHLNTSCLVLVRLAHDQRFVGAVLFLLVLVLFVFIRISERVLPMIAKGLQSILVESSSGMCEVMLSSDVSLGDFIPFSDLVTIGLA
jgi:hypothetical protein